MVGLAEAQAQNTDDDFKTSLLHVLDPRESPAHPLRRRGARASWCGPWTQTERRGAASGHLPGGFPAAATPQSAPSPRAPPAVLPEQLCRCASLLPAQCLAHTCRLHSSYGVQEIVCGSGQNLFCGPSLVRMSSKPYEIREPW